MMKFRNSRARLLLAILLMMVAAPVPATRYMYSVQTQESSIARYRVLDDGTPIYLSHLGTYKYPAALAIHPNGKFLYTVSKSTDEIMVYAIAADGVLTPRPELLLRTRGRSLFELKFHPNGRFLYAAARFSGVVALKVDADSGAVTELRGSPFKAQKRTRDLVVHPSGRFLYAVNAYSNSITVYHINQRNGRLQPQKDFTVTTGQDKPSPLGLKFQDMPVTGGGVPYTVEVHPGGGWLFVSNWAGASVSVFAINPDDGSLRLVGGKPFPSEINPYIVAVHPSGKFVYVGGWFEHKVAGYAFDNATGELKPLQGSPFALQARAPIAIHFSDLGRMYVVNNYANSISIATVGDDGVPVQQSVVQTRSGPREMALVGRPGPVRRTTAAALIRGKDGQLALWRLGEDKPRLIRDAKINGPWVVSGDRVFTSDDRRVRMMRLDVSDGPHLAPLKELPVDRQTRHMRVDPRMGYLYLYDEGGMLQAWSFNDRDMAGVGTQDVNLGKGAVSMSLDAVSRYLFVSGGDSDKALETFRYRLVHDPIVMDLRQYGGRIELDYEPRQVLADRLGSFVLVANPARGGIQVYRHDPQSGIVYVSEDRFTATSTAPEDMSFSADGRRLYSIHNRKGELLVHEFSPVTGTLTLLQSLPRQDRSMRQVLADPDGKKLLVLSDNELKVHTLDGEGKVSSTDTAALPFTALDMQLIELKP